MNDDGQMKSADKNIGTFDEDIERTDWYTEYNPDTFDAKQHDAEYMELARKYLDGTATEDDIMQLRWLVNAQALHNGVERNDFDDPLDLYRGVSYSWGGTEFRPNAKGLILTSTDSYVANGYAGVAKDEMYKPLTRELSTRMDLRLMSDYLDNMSLFGVANRANAVIPGAHIEVYAKGEYPSFDRFVDTETGEVLSRKGLYSRMRTAYFNAMYIA